MIKINKNSLLAKKRQLSMTPKHFTRTSISVKPEIVIWLHESTVGRFSIYQKELQEPDENYLFWLDNAQNAYLAFEDPREAVVCELTWS